MSWIPPFWLRKLDLVRAEHEQVSWQEMSPDERFGVVCSLMAFALTRLRRQAEEDGCSVGELLYRYEQAIERFRSRAT